MVLIYTRGLPASGKTTWAKDWVSKSPNRRRVNADDLRAMMHPTELLIRDEAMWLAHREIIRMLLRNGHDVVVDNTNMIRSEHELAQWEQEFPGLVTHIQNFNVPLEELYERDANRIKSVGREVIDNMYKKYIDGNTNFWD